LVKLTFDESCVNGVAAHASERIDHALAMSLSRVLLAGTCAQAAANHEGA
jgi:hypothetical protein